MSSIDGRTASGDGDASSSCQRSLWEGDRSISVHIGPYPPTHPLIYPLTGLHMKSSVTVRAPNRRLLLQLGWPDGGEGKPMPSFLGGHVGFWWEIHRLTPK